MYIIYINVQFKVFLTLFETSAVGYVHSEERLCFGILGYGETSLSSSTPQSISPMDTPQFRDFHCPRLALDLTVEKPCTDGMLF